MAASIAGIRCCCTRRPVEFEHLVRRLFEAMGMRAWATRASGDDGVDAVAVNTDPIMGGVWVAARPAPARPVGRRRRPGVNPIPS